MGNFMNGALVEFMPTVLVPLPNVIIFQYNPETISHSFMQPQNDYASANPLAVKGMPEESFSFTLLLDSNDQVGEGNPLAISTGIYSRLAALEMLMYPSGAGGTSGLLGTVSAQVSPGGSSVGVGPSGGADSQPQVPVSVLPTVLFIWGPGRIVPVRVTQLSFSETLYDPLLNPTHAEAQIQLTVLTPDELANVSGPLAPVAKAAYAYTQGKRQVLALANLANAAESIIGMIPA